MLRWYASPMRSDMGLIKIDKIKSFDTVLNELAKLDTLLTKNRMKQLLIFNRAYSVITKAIKTAVDDNYFENPQFIEKFSVNFARYYFKALNETASSSKYLPTAWSQLNKAAKYKSTPTFIFLLMGANAHINHDLPLALLELMDKEETDDLLKDVIKIDKLLMKGGRDIIGLFDESNKILDFLKRHFMFVYYRPTMYLILYWRIKAWRDYKSIKKVGRENSGYQKKSITIANRFLKLAAVFNSVAPTK